jgi:hypothetical protein
MKNKTPKTTLFLLLALVFSACVIKSPQTVNVTPLVSQTVKVTIAIPQPVISTDPKQSITTPTLINAIPTIAATQPYQDLGYYDGIIVITQYYTFLGHGFYEEAYQLLGSSARQHSPNLDEYVQNGKQWFKRVQIIAIQPLYVEVEKQGGRYSPPDKIDKKRFFVQIIAWGEGRMSGSAISGDVQTLFITLIQENGEWMIDSFDTAP